MKYKILIIVMFFICVFTLSKVHAEVNGLTLLGKVIYLDAGHGGKDSGAVSNQFLEKDMNLILVKKLEQKLGSKGAIVYLTRDGDYDLAPKNYAVRKRPDLTKRAQLINNAKSDMYISIHLNSDTNPAWKGLQIFYTTKNKENEEIAKVMYNTLKNNISNIKENKKDNSYFMYKQITRPGILIEAGFISNPNDNYLLRQESYQDKLTELIAKGVENYFNK